MSKLIYRGVTWIVFILAGWNDASQGPLLPSLQAIYNVDYLVSKYADETSLTNLQSAQYGYATLSGLSLLPY